MWKNCKVIDFEPLCQYKIQRMIKTSSTLDREKGKKKTQGEPQRRDVTSTEHSNMTVITVKRYENLRTESRNI